MTRALIDLAATGLFVVVGAITLVVLADCALRWVNAWRSLAGDDL